MFRLPMPAAWGGPEMSLRAQCEVVETLSYADPSVGWCVMIGSDGGYYSAFLEDAPGRELFSDLDTVTAGQLAPAGRAERIDGGYRVNGRWAFGSGSTHADVIAGGVMVFKGDEMVLRPDGVPDMRVMMAPADRWTVLDTWHTTGLAGSGSNDYTAEDLEVPEEHTFSLFDACKREGPLYSFAGLFTANMAGVALGLARRAIDEVREIAETKMLFPELVLMKDTSRVKTALARAEMAYAATRAFTYSALDQVSVQLERGEPLTLTDRSALAMSRIHAFHTARDLAILMMDTAGAQSIYAKSPLDRLTRDALTLCQHIVVQERTLEATGNMLLGNESGLPFL